MINLWNQQYPSQIQRYTIASDIYSLFGIAIKDYGPQYLRLWVSGFDPGILSVHRTLPRSHIIEDLETPISKYITTQQNKLCIQYIHNQQIINISLRNKEYISPADSDSACHCPYCPSKSVYHQRTAKVTQYYEQIVDIMKEPKFSLLQEL